MTRFILISIVFLSAFRAGAQGLTLPVDERGVHTFLEVSKLGLTDREKVSENVKRFFKTNAKSLKLRSSKGDTAFTGTGKMILSKSTAGIGHPVAEVNYNIAIDLKDEKYRVILTDYIVTLYERDRYANFVPTTAKYRLEDKPGKLNRSEWEGNMKLISAESAKLSEKLKVIMSSVHGGDKPDSKEPAAISTKKW
ncbi:MAG: hypothetical protein EOO00_06200 [Chitinophagaceae bacterium]|nr:MAG: hypothetical protein EOO00_06200 [Chitinophagaceae bacterium]